MIECFYNISSIPESSVIDSHGSHLGASDFITLGSRNDYPTYLFSLIKSVPTLRSLIEGSALISSSSFSSDIISKSSFINLFNFLYIYGWCPVLVRRSRALKSFFLTPLDPRFVRTTDDRSQFCYSELPGFKKRITYPSYSPEVEGSSILYISINDLESPYALPLWSSALSSVDILSKVSEYHQTALYNGFVASALVNFNNGKPSTEDKEAIERMVNAKFAGASNAQRIMVSFNDDKDHQADIQTFSTEDVSSRYHDLVDSCKSELFTSFRVTPSIFGLPSGSANALSAIEYKNQFTLFKSFTLEPICECVAEALKTFGVVYNPSDLLPLLSD